MTCVFTGYSACEVEEDRHPGIFCSSCSVKIVDARIFCLRCDNVSFCQSCYDNDKCVAEGHPIYHELARIRDSRNLTTEKILEYRKKCDNKVVSEKKHDSFAFQTWNRDKFKDDPRAFELIKKMLRRENEYRLGHYYLNEYKKSQEDKWKTHVTKVIQERAVTEFLNEAVGIYENVEEGLRFLRAASGNFAEKIEELKECANYVKFTHMCVRGELRHGMKVDLTKFSLIDPQTGKQDLLSDFLHPTKPLVIVAGSYT